MVKNKHSHKKNKILFIIIGVFIIVVIATGVFMFLSYNKNLNYKESITIKVGENLPIIEEYVDNKDIGRLKNKEITWQDVHLEETKIYYAGTYTGYITFRNQKIALTLEVVDDENPIIEGVEDITIYTNEEIDLLKNITTKDNSRDEVSLKIEGDYNTSTVGEYPLSYIAIDKSGNETKKEFKLVVKEKEIPKIKIEAKTTPSENIVVGTSKKGYTIKKVNGIYYVNGILIANKTYDLPSSYAPGGLLNIFMNAFNSMQTDAASQGIVLSIISGYRSYSKQNSLYNNYMQKDGKKLADTYSARPGHSEHQTGLAADISSLDQNFINTPEGKWLNNNCYRYGFIIRYPQGKEGITGYMYEPWHIRYVGVEIATSLYNSGNWITLEEYLGITSEYNY